MPDPSSGEPAWKNPACILITGATSGIGAALARSYAVSGRTLILHGRDPERLAAISESCRASGARVVPVTFDVRDGDTTVEQLRALSQREPIDLAIVNAGVTRMISNGDQFESLAMAREILSVNFDGALATVAGVLPEMRRRQRGQIALMSSLASYIGLPRTPIYSASKAALRTYGEALRAWLAPQGIGVSVITPGFIRTPMTDSVKGPKPGLISTQTAVRLIRKGLEGNQARIAFPKRLAWGLLWLSVLPAPVSERIKRAMGFG
jgi:short-subunit dehydrogenase